MHQYGRNQVHIENVHSQEVGEAVVPLFEERNVPQEWILGGIYIFREEDAP